MPGAVIIGARPRKSAGPSPSERLRRRDQNVPDELGPLDPDEPEDDVPPQPEVPEDVPTQPEVPEDVPPQPEVPEDVPTQPEVPEVPEDVPTQPEVPEEPGALGGQERALPCGNDQKRPGPDHPVVPLLLPLWTGGGPGGFEPDEPDEGDVGNGHGKGEELGDGDGVGTGVGVGVGPVDRVRARASTTPPASKNVISRSVCATKTGPTPAARKTARALAPATCGWICGGSCASVRCWNSLRLARVYASRTAQALAWTSVPVSPSLASAVSS
jgi:hypothetical protein